MFPKSTQVIGRSKCPTRLVVKLWGCNVPSLCKQECCCFVYLFKVLGEGEAEDKVSSVLNP